MYISLSLSNSKAKRRIKKKSSGKPVRISENVFKKMGAKKQKAYLKAFPKSSHRFLTSDSDVPKQEKKSVKSDKKAVTPEKPTKKAKPVKHFKKKIGQEAFDELDKKRQAIYRKEHGNKFSRKHFLEKKPNATQKAKKDVTVYTGDNDEARIKENEKYAKKALSLSRVAMKQDIQHSITASSVNAIATITPNDMARAQKSLTVNRDDNIRTIVSTLDRMTNHTAIRPDDYDAFQHNLSQLPAREENPLTENEKQLSVTLKGKVKKGLNSLTPEEFALYNKVRNDRFGEDDTIDAEYEEVDEDSDEGEGKPEERQGFMRRAWQEAKDWEANSFWRKDAAALMKIYRGEDVDPSGKSNLMVLGTMVAKYALIGAGVAALAVGAGPAAIHMMNHLRESWGDLNIDSSVLRNGGGGKGGGWGAFGSSDELNEIEAIEILYDGLVEQLEYIDLDEMKEETAKSFGKFVSTASDGAGRISYRCLPEERALPIEQKTRWDVFYNGDPIGKIYVDPSIKNGKPTLRSWRTVIYENGFNSLEFPQVDDDDEETLMVIEEPYVLVDEDLEVDNDLELHNPVLMSLVEARQWIRSIVNRN